MEKRKGGEGKVSREKETVLESYARGKRGGGGRSWKRRLEI